MTHAAHARRSVHVAAMPFPSPQGTQGAIAAMLDALHSRGDTCELWTYAHGTGQQRPHYTVRRLFDIPRSRSVRSGPSLAKVALDAQLALRLRLSSAPATPLVAHHVEAAAACAMAGRRFVFFAHTDLVGELPTYASTRLAPLLSRSAFNVQHLLVRHAARVATVSPRLSQILDRAHGCRATYIPTPWRARPRPTPEERRLARIELGLDHDAPVMLYAGNLDAYQGWEDLVVALSLASRSLAGVRLLVATASEPSPLVRFAQRVGVADRIRVTSLHDEPSRQRAHAAADVCLVPRLVDGGLPIKLLEALSRGVAIVATPMALAGLPLASSVLTSTDRTAEAIAEASVIALKDAALREALSSAGSAYLREQHSDSKFFAAFDALCGR